jgi:hypothetical protein
MSAVLGGGYKSILFQMSIYFKRYFFLLYERSNTVTTGQDTRAIGRMRSHATG